MATTTCGLCGAADSAEGGREYRGTLERYRDGQRQEGFGWSLRTCRRCDWKADASLRSLLKLDRPGPPGVCIHCERPGRPVSLFGGEIRVEGETPPTKRWFTSSCKRCDSGLREKLEQGLRGGRGLVPRIY